MDSSVHTKGGWHEKVLVNKTHVELARELALQSPCTRRKYGCLITNGVDTVVTNNQRVSNCCNDGCVRDLFEAEHGLRTDLGAEVHAEQAALIRWNQPITRDTKVLIQGFNRKSTTPESDKFLYPCHACAGMLKFAGFKYVSFTDAQENLYSVSVSEILEYWEMAWKLL